ncbi:rhomboid family intramembrane serine protease [Desulfobacula sp.]|uniref:rhomboid family intramembrane serine protease n=1 Tax=Desulfobacula sp. TaxID=2593537 RepID=UPI00263494D1|nr:rhomboid family intramembrane serine protease [Desulfobacula sp.]
MTKDFITIFTDLPDKKADLIILILTSQNIETHVERESNVFHIRVPADDKTKALSMVKTYYTENKFFRLRRQLQEFPLSSFNSPPAFVIMGFLCLIHAACHYYHLHEDMILKYGASALFILQGETYRAITALLLHSDARHLLGNMAGLLIFGAPVISLSGFGLGPLMLLFTGTLGNLINAHFYQTAHLSIGASTSVMGAAGLLAAYQVTRKGKPFRLDTLVPLCAGAVLVAMFSQGERTDVWAHVFGFLCGLFSGIVFFPLNRTLQFPYKNIMALFFTLLILVSALVSAD